MTVPVVVIVVEMIEVVQAVMIPMIGDAREPRIVLGVGNEEDHLVDIEIRAGRIAESGNDLGVAIEGTDRLPDIQNLRKYLNSFCNL